MSEMTSISREIFRCNHSQITSDPFSKEHDLLMETELALLSAFIWHSDKTGKGASIIIGPALFGACAGADPEVKYPLP